MKIFSEKFIEKNTIKLVLKLIIKKKHIVYSKKFIKIIKVLK